MARTAARRRKKRTGRGIQPKRILTLLCVLTLALAGLFAARKPVDVTVPDWVTVDLLPVNPYSRPGDALERVNGVVIHYVGNPGTTAEQNHSYFKGLGVTGETYASSHFLVGLEGEILLNVPLNEIAYCSSQRNVDTISIECCHPDAGGEFNGATYDALLKLTRWLMETYDLEQDQILRHYDVTGKRCPVYYVEHPEKWEQFLSDLKE